MNLTAVQVLGMIDHALLKPDTTPDDFAAACRLARSHALGSLCLHPAWVPQAVENLAGGPTAVGSVAGFPLGASATAAKVADADFALAHGAAEIDMVQHVAAAKAGRWEEVHDDIAAVVECAGTYGAIVKVILETCYLSEDEKVRACMAAVEAGAAFVKTSTGLGPGGATCDDVRLLRRTAPAYVGVKAAGGIRTLQQVMQMAAAGANRIGSSNTESIIRELEHKGAAG